VVCGVCGGGGVVVWGMWCVWCVWGVWGVWGCGGVGGVGGVGVKRTVPAHSLRSTFHRLHLLRLWTPTILFICTRGLLRSKLSWKKIFTKKKSSEIFSVIFFGYRCSASNLEYVCEKLGGSRPAGLGGECTDHDYYSIWFNFIAAFFRSENKVRDIKLKTHYFISYHVMKC
jgi:hypothetical protein